MSKWFVLAVLTVLLAGGSALAYIFQQRMLASAEWNHQVELASAEAQRIR